MSWDKGFNFRATSGYVTDDPNETYVLVSPPDVYPITRNGVTFGWATDVVLGSGNNSTSVDHRLAGINYLPNSGVQDTFRVDLPAPGDYLIRLAMGNIGAANPVQYSETFDSTTSVLVVNSGTADGEFLDATAAIRLAANWPSQNLSVTRTFATTVLNFKLGTTTNLGGYSTIAHLFVSQVTTVAGMMGASLM